jgi:hypothetical protein
MAFVAWPHSGRTWERSSDRPSMWRLAAAWVSPSGAEPKRRRALVRVALHRLAHGPAGHLKLELMRRRHAVHVGEGDVVVRGVVQAADEDGVGRDLDAKPSFKAVHALRGSLRISAMARALGPPTPPPQAPQSCADSCGLFMLVEPWPKIEHDRGQSSSVRPMSRRMRSAMLTISCGRKPCPSS